MTYPDGYFIDRVFDEINRLTDIKLNGAGSSALAFQYDKLSRRKKLTCGNTVVTDYGFELDNDMNSLIQTFSGSSVTFTYGFNNVHELTSQAISDPANFMWQPAFSALTTTYGTANNLNQYPTVGGVSQTFNTNGCLTGDGVWTFGYDTENHLTSATKSGVSASYVYDPMHRQAQKTVGSVKTRYIYSGLQRIADYDGTSGSLLDRYVFGTDLDEPLIKVSSGGTLTYLHRDRMGNIVALTNNSGVVSNRFTYSPWGESPNMTGTTFGFQGQRFDDETGLYFMKARYYDPKTGRFLQPDPIGYEDGLNMYQFAYNNPNNFRDPLGLWGDWGPTATGPGANGGWGNGWGNNGWSNGYGWGNYHVGYDGGATVDIRLPNGTVIIVDVDAGGIVTDVTPGHEGRVWRDLSPSGRGGGGGGRGSGGKGSKAPSTPSKKSPQLNGKVEKSEEATPQWIDPNSDWKNSPLFNDDDPELPPIQGNYQKPPYAEMNPGDTIDIIDPRGGRIRWIYQGQFPELAPKEDIKMDPRPLRLPGDNFNSDWNKV